MKYVLIITILISAMFALLFTGCTPRLGIALMFDASEKSETKIQINQEQKDEDNI